MSTSIQVHRYTGTMWTGSWVRDKLLTYHFGHKYLLLSALKLLETQRPHQNKKEDKAPRMTLRIPEIPAYVAVVSVCSLLLHAGVSKFFQPRSRPADHREANDEDKNISGQGQNLRIILASRTLKVLGCLVLLGLTIGAAIEGKCGSVAAELEVSVHIMRAVPLTCFLFVRYQVLNDIYLLNNLSCSPGLRVLSGYPLPTPLDSTWVEIYFQKTPQRDLACPFSTLYLPRHTSSGYIHVSTYWRMRRPLFMD